MRGFKRFCGLPSIHGAIDETQIHIQKPHGAFIKDYFSFKSKVYKMQLQVMVHCQKKFWDVFMVLLNSMNDVQILHLSNLYEKAMNGDMFHLNRGEEGIKHSLITNKGYHLLPWMMIPHKQTSSIQHIVLETLYNKHIW